jgi:hypothetical protein
MLPSDVIWRLKRRWQSLRGRTGDFAEREDSLRADEFTSLWYERWAEIAPSPRGWRGGNATDSDRWVRFHSLPRGKRYAETAPEHAEVIRRHFAIIGELTAVSHGHDLIAIGADWDHRDIFSGWTKQHLPGAWPWQKWRDPDDEGDGGVTYFWVLALQSPQALTELLEYIASAGADLKLTDENLSWVYAPYDGGADVFSSSPEHRDAMRDRHVDWLPDW